MIAHAYDHWFPYIFGFLRGVVFGTALANMIAALLIHGNSGVFGFSLAFGIVAGAVNAIVSVFSPFVEWWADNLSARRLGAIGTVILLVGLILQSIQMHPPSVYYLYHNIYAI